MALSSVSPAITTLFTPSSPSSSKSPSISPSKITYLDNKISSLISNKPNYSSILLPLQKAPTRQTHCRAKYDGLDYEFPDPIPEFAKAETEKFENFLMEQLSKKNLCGEYLEEVVDICTEHFSNHLYSEYGGPGTLLVVPFIDMADAMEEQELPGGRKAAEIAVDWARKNVDKDWNEWTRPQ